MRWALCGLIAAWGVVSGAPGSAASIDTGMLERSWPREQARDTEVGRYAVRWRESVSRKGGLFAGVGFRAPLEQERVWDLANDYSDIGTMTPGVRAVRFLERTPTRQVIQVDVKVLWKTLQLAFEVEQDPPKTIRFRLVSRVLGEYRGLCTFADATSASTGEAPIRQTSVELATWLKPSRPVPMRLVMMVERITLLQGVKHFLESCETLPPGAAQTNERSRGS